MTDSGVSWIICPLTFKEALAYLNSLLDYERKPGAVRSLDSFRALLQQLGDPQTTFPSILVAGTKGKGSTATFLAQGLQNAGYRVGLYLSPHLISYRERIQINGEWIPEDRFAAYIETLKALHSGERGIRTVFETLTASAFLYFRDEQVDYAVLEVGLGGRLDATNVVQQKATVLTPIDYDHTAILGTTLTEIAREKAGVITHAHPVFSAPQDPEAWQVIQEKTRQNDALLIPLREEQIQHVLLDIEGSTFDLQVGSEVLHLEVPMPGRFQVRNAALAAMALHHLGIEEVRFDGARIPGRLQVLQQRPWVIVDCAHNPFSLRAALASVYELFDYQDLIVVFGVSKDKDVASMVEEWVVRAEMVFFTEFSNPRHFSAWEMADLYQELGGRKFRVIPSPEKALWAALQYADPEDLILVIGSVYLAGDILRSWQHGTS